MQPSDSEWYEALKCNPLNVPTLTYELKARIKSKALSQTIPSKSRSQTYILICASICCLLGFIVLTPDLFAPTVQTPANPIVHKPLSVQPVESEWQEIIDDQNRDSHNEILHIQRYGDEKMLVFFKKLYEFKGLESFSITTSAFEWDSQQWRSRYSFSKSIGDPRREGTTEKLLTSWLGAQPFVFNGMVNDPQIASVQVKLVHQNLTKQAHIIRDNDGYTYWFIALEADYHKDEFRVEGVDASGKLIVSNTY